MARADLQAVQKSIENDPRFQAIKGKMLNRGSGAAAADAFHLTLWWMWRANEQSKALADAELEAFLEAIQLQVVVTLWVYGPRIDARVNVTSDVNLIPVAEMPFSFEREVFKTPGMDISDMFFPKPTAALTKSIFVEKLQKENGFDEEAGHAQTELSDLALLLNLIPGANVSPCYLTCYYPDHVPPGAWGGSGGGNLHDDVVARRQTVLPAEFGLDFAFLLSKFNNKPLKERESIRLALQRLRWAKCRHHAPANQAVDIGIALEILLLHDLGPNEQIGLMLRLRAAWFLGRDCSHRKQIANVIKEAYTIRSKIAHEGSSKALASAGYNPYDGNLSSHMRILENICVKRIIQPMPDWSDIIFGP